MVNTGTAGTLSKWPLLPEKRFSPKANIAGRVSLDMNAVGTLQQAPEDLIALDDSMTKLAAFDPHKAKIVEQHYFDGMTVAEVAESTAFPAPPWNVKLAGPNGSGRAMKGGA